MSDTFEVITWPEIQFYFDYPGFLANSYLINSPDFLDEYGSSAYFVRKSWLEEIKEKDLSHNSDL